VWPIITLRVIVTFLVTLLFIPVVKILIVAVDCRYVGVPVPTLDLTGNTLACFSFPHALLYALALIFVLVFFSSSLMFSLMYVTLSCIATSPLMVSHFPSYFDPDPNGANPLRRPTARHDSFYIILKILLTMCATLVTSQLLLRLVYLTIMTGLMAIYMAMVMPYYLHRTNRLVRDSQSVCFTKHTLTLCCSCQMCGRFTASFFSSIFSLIHYSLGEATLTTSICYFVFIIPAFAVGYMLPGIVTLPFLQRTGLMPSQLCRTAIPTAQSCADDEGGSADRCPDRRRPNRKVEHPHSPVPSRC
jgi:hypothetical protein